MIDVFLGKQMDSTDYITKEVIKELSGNISCFSIQTEDHFFIGLPCGSVSKIQKTIRCFASCSSVERLFPEYFI